MNYDILGFSLLYEMCYTKILQMLELSNLPLLAKDRAESDPLCDLRRNLAPLQSGADRAVYGRRCSLGTARR
jgi:hypothetical protein